jgi:hypothetical protein
MYLNRKIVTQKECLIFLKHHNDNFLKIYKNMREAWRSQCFMGIAIDSTTLKMVLSVTWRLTSQKITL